MLSDFKLLLTTVRRHLVLVLFGQTLAVAHSYRGDVYWIILIVRMLSFTNHVRLTWGILDVGF